MGLSENDSIQIAWSIGALILVGSGLIARRLPIGQTLKLIALWIAIFAGALLVVSYRGAIASAWHRVAGELVGGQTVGNTLRIPMSDDGHFWVKASVNGVSQRFLIDSGATTTALSTGLVSKAGVEVDTGAMPQLLNTANGEVQAQPARVAEFAVGPIRSRDLRIVTAPAFGDTNVIGMNFLSTLKAWRVEGQTLVLEPWGG